MIRNVRIHIEGSLPVVADLRSFPQPADLSLVCTNMRTTDNKRPSFIEAGDSWFVIPMSVVRFVEMPADAVEAADVMPPGAAQASGALPLPAGRVRDEDTDFEPDEEFLQRIRDI